MPDYTACVMCVWTRPPKRAYCFVAVKFVPTWCNLTEHFLRRCRVRVPTHSALRTSAYSNATPHSHYTAVKSQVVVVGGDGMHSPEVMWGAQGPHTEWNPDRSMD